MAARRPKRPPRTHPRRRDGHWPSAPPVGAALIRKDEPPGLRSKQSPPGRSGPGANQQKPPSNPVARAISPHTQLRCSDPAAASGCGWICLRQIAFVPNACGQIARATDGCVLSPRSRRRNPAGFACGKLRSFRTLAGRLPALRMAASFYPGYVTGTRLDLPAANCVRSERRDAPPWGEARPLRGRGNADKLCV